MLAGLQVHQRLSTMVAFWSERKVFRKATLEALRHAMVNQGAEPAKPAEAPARPHSQPQASPGCHSRACLASDLLLGAMLHCSRCTCGPSGL